MVFLLFLNILDSGSDFFFDPNVASEGVLNISRQRDFASLPSSFIAWGIENFFLSSFFNF
jgi:hypothetical protein